jgi:3-methylfumaryl-CoA hydratase
MKQEMTVEAEVEIADGVCSLSLARRMAALLDHSPDDYRMGDALPRGWHVMMFNPPTMQKQLRHDGAAGLGFTMPDLGLPRLMMGGRAIEFLAEIPIGSAVSRRSTLGQIIRKQGRSGPFALVEIQHEITLRDNGHTAVVETCSYIMRPEEQESAAASSVMPAANARLVPKVPANAIVQSFLPDEMMLFRYSAITDNPHRIHYDYPYATGVEGYPALVVNGSLPQMVLLDMLRKHAGCQPVGYTSRNRAPIYSGSTVTLSVSDQGDRFALAAYNEDGSVAIEAEAW